MGLQDLERGIVHIIAGYLVVPEATALQAVCTALRDTDPLRGISHLTLTTGTSTILADRLGELATLEVDGIPEPIVMRALCKPLRTVRTVFFHRNIRPLSDFRAIERMPALQKFFGRIQDKEARLFLETLIADSPDMRVLDAHFLGKSAKALAVISQRVWPCLSEVIVRGEQKSVPIPWRETMEVVSYHGVCTSDWPGRMPRLHTLVMHDDFMDNVPCIDDLPALKRLETNVRGRLACNLVDTIPGKMEFLVLRIFGSTGGDPRFHRLVRLKTLHVDGFAFENLDNLSKNLEELHVMCTWEGAESLAKAIRNGRYPILKRVRLEIVRVQGDAPCPNDIVKATERMEHLEYMDVRPCGARGQKRSYTYSTRGVRAKVTLIV